VSANRGWSIRKAGPDVNDIRRLLATFDPITLAEMDAVKLMDRSEIKYLFPRRLLPSVLMELRDSYRVFVAADLRLSRYRTVYFDTQDMALYMRHHAGAVERYKVRTREYVDSHLAFLEVKHKTGPSRTEKMRIRVPQPPLALQGTAAEFVAEVCPYPADALMPRLSNFCTRVTLVSQRNCERVTLDLDLGFARGDELAVLPAVVVAEVKYQGSRLESVFAQVMRRQHIRDTSFSKYCIGVSMLYPEVKHNKFKAKQRMVARLAEGANNEPV
jgi:hypothetical protein